MSQKLLDQEDKSELRPSEFMRARHPDLFSDSKDVSMNHLPRELLEYYLKTLTSRKQEYEFEHFCRRLAEKELCPNLIPQTGPLGGGDSQVDTETYPVADVLAIRWYEGVGREASNQRWGFAFSAKKDWRTKVNSDIEKIARTSRGYQLAYFITNQYVKDRTRVEVEESLTAKYGVPLRILDLSWILKCIYEHDRISLATDTLNISGYSQAAIKKVGPRDANRQDELEELEEQIDDPQRYQGVEYQLAEDCLDAALIARGLELNRTEVEGRFQRAVRIANRVGIKQQKLRITYYLAWTEYWWYEDYIEFNRLYEQVEELVIGSDQADDVELLTNLWQILHTAVKRGFITEEIGSLTKRFLLLKAELNRLANDARRPNNSLQARTNLLLLDLTEAFSRGQPVDNTLENLKDVLIKSEGLSEYPIILVIKIIQELGSILTNSDKYDELLEVVIGLTEKRTSEGDAGLILLQRGQQKFHSGKYYDAIKLIGRAQQKLAKDEYKSSWIMSLFICGLAYEAVGLLWAARANILMATNQAFSEFIKNGDLKPATLQCVNRLIWLELQLGRLSQILTWMDFSSVLAKLSILDASVKDKYQNERNLQDKVLAVLLINTEFWNLKWLGFLPSVLDDMGLPCSWMTLLYALGYEDYLRQEKVIPEEESPEAIRDLFVRLSTQPASKDIPEQPELYISSTINLISPVLGCKVMVNITTNDNSLFLAENIIGALEAFLATSLDNDIFPFRSELHINIRPADFLTGLPEYTVNKRRQGEIEVRHGMTIPKEGDKERVAFRDWLRKLILDIMFQMVLIPDAEAFVNEVIKNERSFDRAILFSDVEIGITNLLGNSPKFHLSDWKNDKESENFPLIRNLPWNHGLEDQVKENIEKNPIVFGEGDLPDSLYDLDKLRHKDRRILSFINIPLWNEAKWRATGFIYGGEAAPILALCFENSKAANLIFKEWLETIGEIDENNKLRISIITGVNKNSPLNYKVVVTTNLESYDWADNNFFLITSRCNEMFPQTHDHLNAFLDAYKKAGRYILSPAAIDPMEGIPRPIGNFYIGKYQLLVRPAWQIGQNDPDVIAIQEDDVPIIPEDEKNAPVLSALNRFEKRKRRK